MASKRFLRVYDALPPDAQELLVQKHLAPLLDVVSKDRRKRAASSATDLQQRYDRMPPLNIKAKKTEIATVLLELSRDSKRAVIRERSRREQLLSEAIESFTHWINDIWKVVFEFRTNFRLAHSCLLFVCDAVDQIATSSGGCRCSYTSMFIPVHITRSNGKVVKSFTIVGAHNLEKVLLWVWRDLFMAILASGSTRQRSLVPDMIDDIRVLLGSRALEQLLRGGVPIDMEDDDQDEPPSEPTHNTDDWRNIADDDDDDQDYVSDDSICAGLYQSIFYASHWSWRIAEQQPRLRDLVHSALLNLFKAAPSVPLYTSIISIADDHHEMGKKLEPLIMSVAGYSSENLSAALHIMALTDKAENINTLLETHSHLLRPQDAASLQLGVQILANHFPYRAHAVAIIEEELSDITKVFHATIRVCFGNIDSEVNKTELTQILALDQESLNRRHRVERWVKGILTPRSDTTNPMAFAAFMMGIAIPGLEGTEAGDMLGYLDMEGDDSEVEDLREEFRPNIKGRLLGWVDAANAIKGGSALLIKACTKFIATMPFLSASDVVEEMSHRMADRVGKAHVLDALETVGEFCQKQNSTVVAAKRKANQSQSLETTASTSGTGTSASGSGPGESESGSVPQQSTPPAVNVLNSVPLLPPPQVVNVPGAVPQLPPPQTVNILGSVPQPPAASSLPTFYPIEGVD